MTKNTISVIVICRNEEDVIEGCLTGVKPFAHEVIVIDNGSTDGTPEVAKKAGARIYSIPGLDFSYLRNTGKEKATGDWLLYLDADERPTPAFIKEIKKVTQSATAAAGYRILRENFYFGAPWPKSDRMVRLIRREALIGWHGSLHETALVGGKIADLDASILHYTHNDISSMVAKTNEWSEIESQLRYKSNHPKVVWWRFFRVIATAFYQSYIADGGWRAGTIGIIESVYQAFSMFVTYAKLWEKQNSAVKDIKQYSRGVTHE